MTPTVRQRLSWVWLVTLIVTALCRSANADSGWQSAQRPEHSIEPTNPVLPDSLENRSLIVAPESSVVSTTEASLAGLTNQLPMSRFSMETVSLEPEPAAQPSRYRSVSHGSFTSPRVVSGGTANIQTDDVYRDGGGIELIPKEVQDQQQFSLKISGRLQTRYSQFDDRGPFGNQSVNEFEMERVRLGVRGFVYDRWLRYNIGTDWDSDGLGGTVNSGGLLHAFTQVDLQKAVGIGWGDRMAIRAGIWQTNFGRQITESSKRLQFVDRSILSAVFSPGFNPGIGLLGEFTHDYRRVRYELALLNGLGTGSNRPRSGLDNNPAVTLRIAEDLIGVWERGESDNALSELPMLRVGVSSAFTQRTRRGGAGASDEFDNSPAQLLAPDVTAGQPFFAMDQLPGASERQYDLWMLGFDVSWKYCGWSLHAEYISRWISNVEFDSADDFGDFTHGYYVQGGYFVTEKVEIAARHAGVFSDGSGSASPIPGGYSNQFRETGAALNFYFREHNSKFQIDVFYYDGSPVNSSALNLVAGDVGTMIRAQYQLSF